MGDPVTTGILNLNKPSGHTSRQVVDVVQRLVRPAKAGHAGTLDPLARGVLVVCVGKATRLIRYVQRQPKRYLASFLFGRRSDTEDTDGEVVELKDPPVPSAEAVGDAAATLVGEIQQRPPAYSALKIAGRRAYDLAREGHRVELARRPVRVYQLRVLEYDYPQLTLDIECSGGTYVRSLGRDLAEALGTAAVMSALERTAVGQFRIEDSVAPEVLQRDRWQNHLMPMIGAVADLPRVVVSEAQGRRLAQGQTIDAPPELPAAEEYAAVDSAGRLFAILTRRDNGQLRPLKNLR
jgi:tRNA pseudouridine55 synthase